MADDEISTEALAMLRAKAAPTMDGEGWEVVSSALDVSILLEMAASSDGLRASWAKNKLHEMGYGLPKEMIWATGH